MTQEFFQNPYLWAAAGLGAVVAAAFVALFLNLSARTAATETAATPNDSASRFDRKRYRPMEFLLSPEDERFLAAQRGYTGRLGRDFRSARRSVFRQYLRQLRSDFRAVYADAHLLLLYSDRDRSDLARLLLEQRLRFTAGLIGVEWRLLLHALGVDGVDVSGLLEPVSLLQLRIRTAFEPASLTA